jgi:hypothetical protein
VPSLGAVSELPVSTVPVSAAAGFPDGLWESLMRIRYYPVRTLTPRRPVVVLPPTPPLVVCPPARRVLVRQSYPRRLLPALVVATVIAYQPLVVVRRQVQTRSIYLARRPPAASYASIVGPTLIVKSPRIVR